jgi:hypothetical protein
MRILRANIIASWLQGAVGSTKADIKSQDLLFQLN